jgi:uncharacterized surface protein with fasciclin (FAS1) repeats
MKRLLTAVVFMLALISAAAQAQVPAGRLRVAHYVADAPEVDVYVDGMLFTTEPLPFRRATPHAELATGGHEVVVVAAGEDAEQALLRATVPLIGGHDHTLALVGLLAEDTLDAIVLDDTDIVGAVRDPLVPASYAILLHGISNGPAIDFYFDGTLMLENLAYTEYGVVVVEQGAHDVLVTFHGEPDNIIFQNSGETAPSDNLLLLTVMTGSYPDKLAVSGAVSRLGGYTALDYLGNYQGDASFNTFLALVKQTELIELLGQEGMFTVFAPTDEAFAALPEETLAALEADPQALLDVLRYHIVEANFNTRYMEPPAELTTLTGEILVVTGDEEEAFVNETTRILFGGFPAVVNGNVIAIDTVLLPPTWANP